MKFLTPLFCAASFALSASAFAGGEEAKNFKAPQPVECPHNDTTLFSSSIDYVGDSNFKHSSGHQEAVHYDFEFDQRIPLDLKWPAAECGKWFLKLGLNYDRHDFDTSNQARVPNTLQSISGVIALEYLVKNQTAILLETRPGVYFEHNINGGAFDSPTTLALAYPVFGGDKFYLIVGAAGAALWSPHVIPVVGVSWHINDQWDLRGYLPQPRIVYKACDKLELWAGGELTGGGYKTDNRSDVDPHKLSGAVVTYTDIRVGAGLTWKVKPFTVDLGGGASMQREFNYDRAGSRFRTEPAPYAELSVGAAF